MEKHRCLWFNLKLIDKLIIKLQKKILNLFFFCFKEIQFRIQFDESLGLLDFKTNLTGFCYIQISADQNKSNISEYRKQLVKLHNVKLIFCVYMLILKSKLH
jgi:hypothetical protein